MSQQRPVVLFDVDGTLVDSNWFHTISWWRVFQSAGEDISMAQIHPLIGMGGSEMLETLLGRADDELKERHGKEFDRFLDEIRAFPKAGDLIREVHRRGALTALCTSSQESHLKPMQEAIGADDALTEIVHADDVEHSKPDPDVFAAALEKLDADPDRTLVIGDTKWDIKAADRTGLKTIAVLTGGVPRQELDAAGAVAVYEDVAGVLASLDDDDSPLGRLLRQND